MDLTQARDELDARVREEDGWRAKLAGAAAAERDAEARFDGSDEQWAAKRKARDERERIELAHVNAAKRRADAQALVHHLEAAAVRDQKLTAWRELTRAVPMLDTMTAAAVDAITERATTIGRIVADLAEHNRRAEHANALASELGIGSSVPTFNEAQLRASVRLALHRAGAERARVARRRARPRGGARRCLAAARRS